MRLKKIADIANYFEDLLIENRQNMDEDMMKRGSLFLRHSVGKWNCCFELLIHPGRILEILHF